MEALHERTARIHCRYVPSTRFCASAQLIATSWSAIAAGGSVSTILTLARLACELRWRYVGHGGWRLLVEGCRSLVDLRSVQSALTSGVQHKARGSCNRLTTHRRRLDKQPAVSLLPARGDIPPFQPGNNSQGQLAPRLSMRRV